MLSSGQAVGLPLKFLLSLLLLGKFSECGPTNSVYFPSELHNIVSRLTPDDIRSFIHTATFVQNSNVMTLESKVPGLNVLTAIRNFQQSKIGDYYRTLLRMWAKFGKEDRLKNKEEMFRNIESLKIPENFKTAFKSMFEHVDGLQKVIINAVKTTPAPTTTTTTTTPDTTFATSSEESTTSTSIFALIAEEFSVSPDFQSIAPAVIV